MSAEIITSGTVPQRSDTRRLLLVKMVNASGGGGGGQIVAYTGTDPNSDGVTPSNKNAIAIAVKPGAGEFTWSVAGQTWV